MPKFNTSTVFIRHERFTEALVKTKQMTEGPAFDRAVQNVGRMATALIAQPARDLDEVLLKIEVAQWAEGEEQDALEALRKDLERLQHGMFRPNREAA